MEVLHEPPSLDSFTPLTTHQSQTPSSFYEGPPVLHHHTRNAQLVISTHDLNSTPALSNLQTSPDPPALNGHADADNEQDPDIVLRGLDVFVTSERFIIFAPATAHGLAIPYPSISLHAIQRLHLPPSPSPGQQPSTSPPSSTSAEIQGLFMQISTSDGYDDHDADATISLTIVPAEQSLPLPPASSTPPSTTTTTTTTTPPTTTATAEIQALFAAVSACSNLHPDAMERDSLDGADDDAGMIYGDGDGYDDGAGEGDGDGEGYVSVGQGGLPPPMPGSGGWITAENVGEFFDGEGNWRGAGGGRGLGRGAGVVRGREEEGEEDGVGGEGDGGEETKWRRTAD